MHEVHRLRVFNDMKKTISINSSGIGLGCALAVTISYAANKSILWAILHGILSWLFVIYAAIFYP